MPPVGGTGLENSWPAKQTAAHLFNLASSLYFNIPFFRFLAVIQWKLFYWIATTFHYTGQLLLGWRNYHHRLWFTVEWWNTRHTCCIKGFLILWLSCIILFYISSQQKLTSNSRFNRSEDTVLWQKHLFHFLTHHRISSLLAPSSLSGQTWPQNACNWPQHKTLVKHDVCDKVSGRAVIRASEGGFLGKWLSKLGGCSGGCWVRERGWWLGRRGEDTTTHSSVRSPSIFLWHPTFSHIYPQTKIPTLITSIVKKVAKTKPRKFSFTSVPFENSPCSY